MLVSPPPRASSTYCADAKWQSLLRTLPLVNRIKRGNQSQQQVVDRLETDDQEAIDKLLAEDKAEKLNAKDFSADLIPDLAGDPNLSSPSRKMVPTNSTATYH